jgi:protein-S-isoprenylcysteine O-methyltransferase Ste14
MRSLLQFAGWALCIVYTSVPLFWFMIHPFADHWRVQRRNPYRVLLPGWIAMWILIGFATSHWRRIVLYGNPWTWIPGIVFLLCGFWLYHQSTRNFSGKQVGGFQEVLQNQQQRLVISGIRGRIRHPMYLGHFCGLLGWSIGTGLAVCYGLTLFAVITGAIMIRREDNELELRFGEPYRIYRQQVPAFLPKI